MDNQELFYKEVGKLVRKERAEQKLTQEDLAEKEAVLTRTIIANIETGRQQILLHIFIAIADGLNVEPQELLPRNNSRENAVVDKNKVKKQMRNSKEARNLFTDFFDDSDSDKR